MYRCLSEYMCTLMCTCECNLQGNQKEGVDLLELELQAVLSCLTRVRGTGYLLTGSNCPDPNTSYSTLSTSLTKAPVSPLSTWEAEAEEYQLWGQLGLCKKGKRKRKPTDINSI